MKKNWMKKLSAALCAATLFASGFATKAFAQEDYTVTPFTYSDFDDLTGNDQTIGEATQGTITVNKFITERQAQTGGNPTDADPVVPVSGVEFTLVKVGQYATVVKNADGTASTMIGIDEDFAKLVIDDYKADNYVVDSGYAYMTSNQYNNFNSKMEAKGNALAQTLETSTWWTGLTTEETDEQFTDKDGKIIFTYDAFDQATKSTEFGIYVVVETDVTKAQANGKNVLFSKKQYPYIVSLPYTTQGENAKWSLSVNAKAKNVETTVSIDKKIERNSSSLTGKMENPADTDVTHIGDTVEFTLITDVPMIEDHESVQSYVITDEISAGLTLPETFGDANIKITDSQKQTYTFGKDYTVAKYAAGTDVTAGYATGFTITFTETGRAKIANAAHVDAGGQEIYTSYTATVNSNAIVGKPGNPNQVKLDLAAAGSGNIEVPWEYVTEYVFSMEGNKTFDGNPDGSLADEVTFELYLDEAGTQRVVLNTVNGADGTENAGRYTYGGFVTGEGAKATVITLDATGSFSIKGVPVTLENDGEAVTLYLKETATADGYNKLTKLVPIVMTPTKDSTTNEYDGTLASGTVNNKPASVIYVGGEGIAVSADATGSNSGISFTVNNTSGFQLPSTGGMGIWMFVIGGMAVIGCGLLYYRKNAKSAK